jgi:hypothetical protein
LRGIGGDFSGPKGATWSTRHPAGVGKAKDERTTGPCCQHPGVIAFIHAVEVLLSMSEIIFEVREDEVDGGFTASALGYGIHTQGDTVEELRAMVKDAVRCYFDEAMEAPKIIRLHFVRDEVLV